MLAERTGQREVSDERIQELSNCTIPHRECYLERRSALAISREDVGGLGGSFAVHHTAPLAVQSGDSQDLSRRPRRQ